MSKQETRSNVPDQSKINGNIETGKFLRDRYSNALNSDVQALAFDLDGTAIDPVGRNMHDQGLHLLSYLLRCDTVQIPMTGRGVGSTDEIIVQRLQPSSIRNLVIGNYNGCLVRRYDVNSQGEITPDILFEAKLPESERILETLTDRSPWKNDLLTEERSDGRNFVSKSRDYGVTLVFKNDQLPPQDEVMEFLRSEGYAEDVVQLLFSGRTYDIISAHGGKDNAITQIARLRGLDRNKIARVGDQGKPGQNDYDMLRHPLGFTVGARDMNNPFGCHPVVNAEGTTLTGLDAFGQLVYDLKFEDSLTVPPSTYNNKYQRSGYVSAYHAIANEAKHKLQRKTEERDTTVLENNDLLQDKDAMHYMIDRRKRAASEQKPERTFAQEFSFNGAIMMKESEVASLPDSPLRDFMFAQSSSYGTESDPRYKYRVSYGGKETDESNNSATVYTRAEAFYSSMKDGTPTERFASICETEADLLNRWKDVTTYVKEHKLNFAEWKTALAYFDNYKFANLQMFHAFSYLKTNNFLTGSPEENDRLNESMRSETAGSVSDYFAILDMQRPTFKEPDMDIIATAANKVQETLGSLPKEDEKNASKAVRGIIEADHPYYNRIYAESAADRVHDEGLSDVVLAGLHYGGIELPFIVSHYLNQKYPDISHEMMSVHFSKYSNPLNKSLASESLYKVTDRQLPIDNRTVALLDDGIFSGESLYRTGLLTTYMNGKVIFSAESIGNGRRLGHMMSVGGADPDFIRHELPEIIRISPFRKVDTIEKFNKQGSFNLVKARVKHLLSGGYPAELSTEPQNDPFSRLRK